MGIIAESQETMKEFKGAPALGAGLLAAAQAVEHYETARYGTLKTWAAELGLNRSAMIWAAHFQANADPGALMEPSANSSRSEVAQVQAPVGHRQPTQNDLPPSVREEEAPNAKAGQQQEFPRRLWRWGRKAA